MIYADIHTHTAFSPDSHADMADMLERAVALGLKIYGVSEHFNYDYDRLHLQIDGKEVPPIDEAAYFSRAQQLQAACAGKLLFLVGAEFGFDHSPRALERYMRTAEEYRPDFIVNSIHP